MLIEVLTEKSTRQAKKVLVLKCDQCQIIFKRKYSKRFLGKSFHFHCIECKNLSNKLGGALLKASIETCKEKYDTDFPNQAEEIRKKKIETCRERYGVDFSISSPEARKKSSESLVKKYGFSSYLATKECRDNLKSFSLDKWGVEHPSQSEEIKSKKRETSLKRYGVDNISKSEEIKLKKQKTCQERYGVDNPFQSDEIVSHIDKPTAWRKRFETMKNRGTILQSSVEENVYQIFCNKFGVDDVERQVLINNRWPIDFYVMSLNVYIQFDGVYWHGLDRQIEEIAQHKTKQDVVIHKKWITDREQDEWFKSKNLKLFRLSERDLTEEGLNKFFDKISFESTS